MAQLPLHTVMVAVTMVMFVLSLAVNEWVFTGLEFTKGINWVYLPAGVRLLSTLLFGASGAVGLLLVSWLVSFFYFFPDDPVRAFAGGILAAAGPYLTYCVAQRLYGLQASLSNLTPQRLLLLSVGCSVASPALHHLWFFASGTSPNLIPGFLAMFVGDLSGTFIVVYTMKMLLVACKRGRG